MLRWQKWTLAALLTMAVLWALAVFVLPSVVRERALRLIGEKTGRPVAIERITFNPWTLRAGVYGFRLGEKGDAADFVAFERLDVALSLRSVIDRALIIREFHLEKPQLRVVRSADHAYNFSDLLVAGEKPADSEAGEPFHFSLNNLTMAGGSIDFIDRGLSPEQRQSVRQIELAIPFIGNVPYLADRYVTPLLAAEVNGSPLRFEGQLKPFAETVEASVDIDLRDLDLPHYAAYLPRELPIRVDAGRLSTSLDLIYRAGRAEGPQVELSGDIDLRELALSEADGAPLLALPQLAASMAATRPFAAEVHLASLVLEAPEIYLVRDRQGGWNVARLAGPPADRVADATGADAGKTAVAPPARPVVTIGNLSLNGGRLHFTDAVPAGGFSTVIEALDLSITDFRTSDGYRNPLTLSLATARQERLTLDGSFSLYPLAAEAEVRLDDLSLAACNPYLASVLTRPVAGSLSASGRLNLAADGGLRLDDGTLKVQSLVLPFGGQEGFKLGLAEAGGISLDLAGRSMDIARIALDGGDLRFSRGADGILSPLSLLRSGPAETGSGKSSGQEFAYRIGDIGLHHFKASFTDFSRAEKPVFRLRSLDLTLAGLHSPGPAVDSLRLKAGYGRRGTLAVSGKGSASPLKTSARLNLKGIPLEDFTPYLPGKLQLVVADGTVDAALDLRLHQQGESLAGSLRGNLGVRSFYLLDGVNGDDLMRWESLQFDGLEATLKPFALDIDAIVLNNYLAKIIVNPDATLNLQHAFGAVPSEAASDEAAEAPLPEPAPVAAADKTDSRGAEAPRVAIDAVTLQGGTVDFTDRHMSPTFHTTMYNVGGRISGLNSETDLMAEVDLRGNLENQSPLTITGTINPLRADPYLDLSLKFSDIELSPASSYTGRYLGYLVEKGKLFLDLHYHIENHRLESHNRIFLDQFTFGSAVESPEATSLPVRLAVALLKDRKGEIHLDLPVSGRTDDPEFSIWRVVLKVLRNLLVKAATSPITLLTSMFGGEEEFTAVVFPYGSSRLPEAEQEKLAQLARALKDRPALKLELSGFADRDGDPEPYRHEVLRAKMQREKYLQLVKEGEAAPGTTAETVEIAPDERSVWLKEVYDKAKFPKPRNFIGLAKRLPDDEMEKLLLANTPAGEAELAALAWARGEAARRFLTTTGGVAPERIFNKRVDVFQPAKGGKIGGNRVEFSAVAP